MIMNLIAKRIIVEKKRQTRYNSSENNSSQQIANNTVSTSSPTNFTSTMNNFDHLQTNEWALFETNVTDPGIVGFGDDILQIHSSPTTTSLLNNNTTTITNEIQNQS